MMVTEKQRTNRSRRVGRLLGIGLAGVLATPASAQTVNEPINELAFSVTLRHDDHLASTGLAPGSAGASDQRATVGAQLTISRPLGRNTIAVNAFAGYDFYRRNKGLNRERLSLGVDAGINVGPCLLQLTPSFSRRQSEVGDIEFLNVSGLDRIRNTQTEQIYANELRCGSPHGIRPLVRYERAIGDNSHPARKLSNYRSNSYAAGVGYSNVVLGDYDLTFERRELEYPNRPPNVANGYRRDSIKISGSRDIGSVLVAAGYVAFTNIKPKNQVVAAYKGVAWSVSGTATPLPALRLQSLYSQEFSPSLGTSALYTRVRDLQLTATYTLSSRTSLSVSASRSTRLYRGSTAIFGPLLTDDRRDMISGGLDFTPSRRLQFGLDVTHERRNANGTIYDYKNTIIALNTRFSLGAI